MKVYGRAICLVATALALASCAGDRFHRDGMNALEQGRVEDGLAKLEQAVRAEPDNVQFRRDLLMRRSDLVVRMLATAESDRAAGKFDAAETGYRRVIGIEPANSRATAGLLAIDRERRYVPVLEQAKAHIKQGEMERAASLLRPVLAENPAHVEAVALRRLIDEANDKAQLNAPTLASMYRKPISLEFRDAGLKLILDALARKTGIDFILDKDVRPDLRTTVILRGATLDDAVELILQTNHLEKKLLNRNTVLIYANTPDNVKEYQELVVKGFYLANADVRQTQTMLKNILKSKDMYVDEKLNMLVLRDTPDAIKLAEKLIAMHDLPESEVMLEVEVLEVKRSRLIELGVQWSNQLTFSPLLGTPNRLSELRGLTSDLIGVTPPSATLNLRRELGDANILANPRIRARNREKAKIMIGDRVPVTNSTTTATGIVSESVQYLDVGIKLEVEPNIYLQDDVGIKIALEVSSLVREIRTPGGSLAYQIGSRSATTALRLKDGETQVLAGLISEEDRRDASRVPGIGELPLLGRLFGSQKDDRQKTEIVLSITPRLVRNITRPDAATGEFWSGTETALRTRQLTLDAAAQPAPDAKGAPEADVRGNQPDAGDSKPPTRIDLSWAGPAQAKVGEQFKLAVKMKSDGGVRSLPFQLAYDPAVLQVIEVSEGAYFKKNEGNSSISSNVDPVGGKVFVSVVRSGSDGVQGDANVAILTLRALAAKPTQVSLLYAAPISIGDKSLQAVLPAPLAISVSN